MDLKAEASLGSTRYSRRPRLLFVDDEVNILQMLARLLQQSGEEWDAELCGGVDEALGALARANFDTVVTDVRMPFKDGFVLLESMRSNARFRHIPVIVLTGDLDESLKRRALDLGATDLLNKPTKREDLIARLRSALRLKEYQDRLGDQVALLEDLVQERTRQVELSHREVVWRLAKAGEFRDDQTGSHVARVAWCSCVLAEALSLDKTWIDLLLQTSPLHDIGKIGIPDSILLKTGSLTAEERRVVERHTLIGENILRSTPRALLVLRKDGEDFELPPEGAPKSPLLEMACVIARCHHEKWDGTGYPAGLAGLDIPLEARIVGLTDVYDALLSERPYKRAMSQVEALSLIQRESGHHFDPELVKVFVANIARIQETRQRCHTLSENSSKRGAAG